jgi:hypothetical protein
MQMHFKEWECILSHVNLNPNFFFSSWAKHEFKMSHEPNEMQHIPIQDEKCVQVSRKATQATF